jgi:hypothetical protein
MRHDTPTLAAAGAGAGGHVSAGPADAAEPPSRPPAMRAEVPVADRRQVTGARMTAIYVDTGRVLHRVRPSLSPTAVEVRI